MKIITVEINYATILKENPPNRIGELGGFKPDQGDGLVPSQLDRVFPLRYACGNKLLPTKTSQKHSA